MFAIDTNLLVYAHNRGSEFNEKSVAFLERVLNERDGDGNLSVSLPTQVLMEFLNVITWQKLKKPLSLTQAISVIEEYLSAGIPIVGQKETQIQTFLDLMRNVKTRKRIFDVSLAATLKDNGITGIYTVNVSDFDDFNYIEAINPLKTA